MVQSATVYQKDFFFHKKYAIIFKLIFIISFMNTLHRLINSSKISQQNSSVIEKISDKLETIFHHSLS